MAAYTYWHVSNGLRGCYMPDDAWTARVRTRRELKDILAEQCRSAWDEHAPSRRAVASLAAAAWREWGPGRRSRQYLPMCAPYPGENGYGLFVGPATKQEWAENMEGED